MVKLLHEAGPGSHPRRRLQPHRRRRPGRARPSASADWVRTGTTAPTAHGKYLDTTGCGNSLNFGEPRVVADGPGLPALLGGRIPHRRVPLRPGRDAVPQRGQRLRPTAPLPGGHRRGPCPVATSKLIAEPWDVGLRRLADRPVPAAAGWTGTTTSATPSASFWLADRAAIDAGGQGGSVARLAGCLSGSAATVRRLRAGPGWPRSTWSPPTTGSPSHDLMSFDRKHNEANGEQNRDGHGDNRSYNHGVEGPTENGAILRRRAQSRAEPDGLAADLPRRAHDHRRRRTRALPAGQQQRLLPGQRHRLAGLDPHAGVGGDAAQHLAVHPAPQGIPGRPTHDFPVRDEQSYLHWFDQAASP